MKLDIGCGGSKREGFIGVDILKLDGVDIVHNLTSFPYPFEDNSVDEIWMDQVLEHLQNPMRVIEELHRICKHDAKITIGVPYFRSFYAVIDPTHVNFFGIWWFNYFDPTHAFCKKYQYSSARFMIKKIEFDREFKGMKMRFWKKWLINYAEKKPASYEARLSHLFPLNSLTFHLTAVK